MGVGFLFHRKNSELISENTTNFNEMSHFWVDTIINFCLYCKLLGKAFYTEGKNILLILMSLLLTYLQIPWPWLFEGWITAIHRINHYPVYSVVCFVNTYPLDSVIQPLNNRGLVDRTRFSYTVAPL